VELTTAAGEPAAALANGDLSAKAKGGSNFG